MNWLHYWKARLIDPDSKLGDVLAVAVTVAFFIVAMWMWGRSGL